MIGPAHAFRLVVLLHGHDLFRIDPRQVVSSRDVVHNGKAQQNADKEVLVRGSLAHLEAAEARLECGLEVAHAGEGE